MGLALVFISVVVVLCLLMLPMVWHAARASTAPVSPDPAMAMAIVPALAPPELGQIDGNAFTHKGAKVECKIGDAASPSILLVMQHGLTRQLNAAFSTAKRVASDRGSVQILPAALRFPIKGEEIANGSYWDEGGWIRGSYPTGGPGANSVSSYEILDSFVHTLVNKHKASLKRVIVAGHSAGGQVVCRYAAYGELPENIETFYLIMSPSSYMWLTPTRPNASPCSGKHNNFIYGLDNLPQYMTSKGTAEQLRARFMARNICVTCNKTDTGTAMLDQGSSAMCQGANRYERYVNYVAHLKDEMKHPSLKYEAGEGNGHSPNISGQLMKSLVTL